MAPETLQSSTMARELKSSAFWRDVISEFVAMFMLMTVQCVLPLSWSDSDNREVR